MGHVGTVYFKTFFSSFHNKSPSSPNETSLVSVHLQLHVKTLHFGRII